jgi:pimeloyl-[acyl-carrier protein] methyl ester esterase
MIANAYPAAGEHPPRLVLLHGFALHGGIWGSWLGELGERAGLATPDLPGHGGRPWDDRIRDLTGLAEAVSDRVPDGAFIVGWSLGGMLALELARLRPGRVAGLVLIATTPRFVADRDWPLGIKPRVLEEFARGLAIDYHRTVQDFLALQVHGAADPQSTLRLLRKGLRSRPAPDPQALATGVDILRHADLRQMLRGIEAPAIVIAGQHDRLTHPDAGEYLAGALPQAEFRTIVGAGHAPFLSHPAVVALEALSFVARHAARPSAAPASG